MMIQVTTTDSEIPPRTGSVNTVSQFSSSISVSAKFPVLLPPFLIDAGAWCGYEGDTQISRSSRSAHVTCYVKPFHVCRGHGIFLHKKRSCSPLNPLNPCRFSGVYSAVFPNVSPKSWVNITPDFFVCQQLGSLVFPSTFFAFFTSICLFFAESFFDFLFIFYLSFFAKANLTGGQTVFFAKQCEYFFNF